MNYKEFFIQKRSTWIIFGVTLSLIIINSITLNYLDFGSQVLLAPIALAIIAIATLGPIFAKPGVFFPSPTVLGWVLVVLLNILIISIFSIFISKIYNKIKSYLS